MNPFDLMAHLVDVHDADEVMVELLDSDELRAVHDALHTVDGPDSP